MLVHPFADAFPMLDDEELERLSVSIAEQGLRTPIVRRRSDGMILDGRNRLRACEMAGVEPKFQDVELDDARCLALILDFNVVRRHMTTSQRAAAAAEYAHRLAKVKQAQKQFSATLPQTQPDKPEGFSATLPETKDGFSATLPKTLGGRPGSSQTESAKEAAQVFHVSERTVRSAQKVLREDPESFSKVKSGELTVAEATKCLDLPEVPEVEPGTPSLIASMQDDFDEAIKKLRSVREIVSTIAEGPGGKFLRPQPVYVDLTNIVNALRHARPFCVCTYCSGRDELCTACKGAGWITQALAKAAPKESE